jgi:hypothetical protein
MDKPRKTRRDPRSIETIQPSYLLAHAYRLHSVIKRAGVATFVEQTASRLDLPNAVVVVPFGRGWLPGNIRAAICRRLLRRGKTRGVPGVALR